MTSPVISRMRETRVRPGRLDDYVAWLLAHPPAGCVRAEVYRSYDGPDRVVELSHWADEAALAAYAGPGWRTDPAVVDAEREYLARDPHVWHFTPAGE